MGYDQYTVPVEPTFFSFPLAVANIRPWPCHFFSKFLWRTVNSKPPTIPFGTVESTFSDNSSQNSCICHAFILLLASLFSIVFSCGQDKFSKEPSVFVTAAHHHAGLKRDAASIWLEDITHSSFKICLRELQNYAGWHEDIHVVSNISLFTTILTSYFVETIWR